MKTKKIKYRILLLISILLLNGFSGIAEGTKQTQPNSGDAGYLHFYRTYNDFARYNCTPEERLNIKICNAGEVIHFGFRQDDEDIEFRLIDPLGNIVIAETNVPRNGDEGYISSHARAVAGPQEIVGGAGYDAISYTTTMAGDYYIEFNYDNRRTFTYWDITVSDAGSNAAIDGRVWSQEWQFSTGSFAASFQGTLFVYADDGIVTTIGFNGIQPYVFTVACNPTGVINNNNPSEDRKSVRGNSTYAQYKIFLNDPDPNCYPTGVFGDIIGDPTVTGCGANRCINIETDQTGQAVVLLDLNGVPGFQPGTADLQIQYQLTIGPNCVPWNGNDGNGNPVVSGTMIDVEIDYLNGITHLPIYDVENHRQGYNVTLVRPAGPAPQLFWDDVDNIPNGTQELNGCTSPCHTWRWNNRERDDAANDYGNRNTINTWWYANIVQTELDLTVIDLDVDANVNIPGKGADNDTTLCSDITVIQLAGNVTGAPSGIWSTDGDGTFSAGGTDQTGTYTPGPNDFINGRFRLTLTSVGGSCATQSDFMEVNLQPLPSVNAGGPYSSCSSDPAVTLGGSFSNAGGIEWTGGNGIFVPNRFTQNATYTPDTNEINNGSVTLTLTSTGNGLCSAASSTTALVNILPQPEVITGDAIVVCSNTPDVSLNGIINNATGGTWSGGLGSYLNGNQAIDVYTPTQTEIDNGILILTLTSNGQAPICSSEDNDFEITFTPTPTSNAGTVANICDNDTIVSLNGTITGTDTYFWSAGSGKFSDSLTLNPTYVFSEADISNGSVNFTLTAIDTSGCLNDISTITSTVTAGPTVDAGVSPLILCANNQDTTLTVVLTGATGVQWIGNGGTFSPNTTSTTVNYSASLTEIDNGSTILYVETTGNGTCPPTADTLEFVYLPEPQLNLSSSDITVCENNPEVSLSGVAIFATSTQWLLGSGSFTPGRNTLNTTYTPTATEISNGGLNLVLSADRQSCLTVFDTVNITIEQAPIVDAGSPQSICSNNPNIQLNGSVQISSGGTWEGGNGSFSTSNTDLNSTYTPTPSEIASGSLKLFLRSTPFGTCNEVIDSVEFTFTPSPTLEIGPDITVCRNNARTNLSATITVANSVTWTTAGGGNFRPNANQISPDYVPNNTDRNDGSVEIYATTTGNGNCNQVIDTLTIIIEPNPTISSFTNNTVCAESPDVSYTLDLTGAGGVQWSGGDGTYSPNDTSTSITYTPSATEVQNGSARLTATTTNNGLCNSIQRSRNITIQPTPIVVAGNNMLICGNNLAIQLSGNVQNSTNGGRWHTNGTGNFDDRNDLNTIYNATANDTVNSPIQIWLESRGNGRCNAQSDTIEVDFVQEPIANAGASTSLFCSNQFPFLLNGSGSTGSWTGGNGTFTPSRNVLNPEYTPTQGELTSGSLILTYVTDAIGPCASVSDDITIQLINGPEALAGNDQTICGNENTINLTGVVNDANGSLWTTTGSGAINANATDLSIIYDISPNDTTLQDTSFVSFVLATTGNLQCPEDFDTVSVAIAPTPYIEAGPAQTLCALNGIITLNGDSLNVDQITWSGGNGGTFSPNTNAIQPNYTVTNADTTAGFIEFILSSQANTICPSIFDTVNITLEPAPIIDAGLPQTVCADSLFIDLAATVTNALDAEWINSGTGNFSPNGSGLNTSYFFSTNDTSNSPITFYAESTGNGSCPPATDSVEITITPAPSITLTNDTTLCEDVDSIQVSAVITIATDVAWSSTGSGSFTSPNGLNTFYLPSANDIQNGIVTLTGTTLNSGNCNEVSEIMIVSFSPAPTIFAGLTQTICAGDAQLSLNGTISVSQGSNWTTNGSGTIASPTSLNTTYTINSADTTNGFVDFFLQTTGNGSCNSYFDTIRYNFQSIPEVITENDFNICADSLFIEINSTNTNSNGVSWSTNGDGNFFPSANIATTNYSVTDVDTTNGSVQFIATTTGSGVCPEVTDTLNVTIDPAPIVDPGIGQTICSDSSSIQLNGSVTHAGGGYWITSGTGTFSPDSTALKASYSPSAIDTTLGQIRLTLISSNNGLCNAVRDNIVIDILPEPILEAGPSLVICAEQLGVRINSTISNSNSVVWSTSGTGVFGPNAFTRSPMYFPSGADTVSGVVRLSVSTTGNSPCQEKTDTLSITMLPVPIANAGNDQTVCADATGVSLNGTTTNSSSSLWTTSGTGKFTPTATSLNAQYVPSVADTTNGSVVIYLDAFSANSCSTDRDSLTITFEALPIITAGNNISICRDVDFVNLGGIVTNAPGAIWSTSGSGYFAPTNTSMPGQYLPDGNDTTLSFVTLTVTSTGTLCPAVSDNMRLRFTPIPTVNAGNETTVCLGIDSVQLSGFVTNASSGRWKTSGTGTFSDSLSLNTYYYPSNDDQFIDGTVLLTLISTGSNNCLDYEDTVRINFGIPFIEAGNAITACDSDYPISLNGSGTSGEWIGGNGTFSPNRFANTATYTPTPLETAAGSIKLIRSSINDGTCLQVRDSVIVTLLPGPTLNPVNPVTVCDNETSVSLSTTVNIALGVKWRSSGTGSFDNDESLTPTYTPSNADFGNDTIDIYVASTQNGSCGVVTDTVSLRVEKAPKSRAGNDIEICADSPIAILEGTITNSLTGEWESLTGSGSFNPNSTQLATQYTLDATEVSNLSATIILKTTDNGNCTPAVDTIEILVLPAPTINAGLGGDLCPGQNQFKLNASISNAVGGKWTSSGDGSFSPSDTSKNATYTLGATDGAPTDITVTYTSFGNGLCNAVSDDTIISFVSAPIAIAGNDQSLCDDQASISLNGQIQNANGGKWISTGSGSFSPNDSTLNAVYIPSTSDRTNRLFNLILISTGNGFCSPDNSDLEITLIEAPVAIINAGNDIDVCSDASTIELNGFFRNAEGVVWSTINGGGSFSPEDSIISASYVPVSNDTVIGTINIVLSTYGTNACGNVSDTANINFIPTPTLNIGSDIPICEDSNFVNIVAQYTGATGVIWNTTGGGSFASSRFVDSVFYSLGGNDVTNRGINISAKTISNGYCESISDELIISLESSASISSNNLKICETNSNVTLSAITSDNSPVFWATTGSGSFVDSLIASPTYNIDPTDPAAGALGFTVTNISLNACPNTSKNIKVTFDKEATIEAGPAQDICENNITISTSALGTNFDQVTWRSLGTGAFNSNPNNLNLDYTPSATDISNGTLQLTVNASNNSSCPGIFDTLNINFTSAPSIALTRGSLCEIIDGVQLNAVINNASGGTWTSSGNGSFSINNNDLNATYFPTISELQTNATTITISTNGNGNCNVVTESIEIPALSPPTANAGADKYTCDSEGVTLQATIESDIDYNWYNNGGGLLGSSANLTVNPPITTTYILEAVNIEGCATYDTIEVHIFTLPTLDLPDEFCYSDTLLLNSNPTNLPNVPGIFQWRRNALNLAGENAPTHNIQNSGLHEVIYNYGNCFVTDSSVVHRLPEVNVVKIIGCSNEDVSFTTNTITGATYTWFVDNSLISGNTDSTGHTLGTTIDTVYYKVNVLDLNNCITTDSARLITMIKPIIIIDDTNNCDGSFILLDGAPLNYANLNNYVHTYSWNKDSVNINHSFDTLTVTQSGDYDVTLTIDQCVTTDSALITFNPNPTTGLRPDFDFCSEIDTTVFLVANPSVSYFWQPGGETTQVLTITEEGEYSVTVTNNFGCEDTDSVYVTDVCPPRIFIADAFTPNVNGDNNMFYVKGKHFVSYQIRIYNRWGEVIFYSDDPNYSWDGTYLDELMPVGSYAYIVWYEGIGKYSGIQVIEGKVTLIR